MPKSPNQHLRAGGARSVFGVLPVVPKGTILGFGFSASETMRFAAEDGILEMQRRTAPPSSEGLLGGVFTLNASALFK